MPLYQCDVEGRSPLTMQLTAGASGARVVGWDAFGSGPQGSTTRPTLYRPSTPGISRASEETAYPTCLDFDGRAQPNSTIATIFARLPSPPETSSQFSADLPFRSSAYGLEIDIAPGESIVLFAMTDFEGSAGENADKTSRVHTWHCSIQWEEN